MTEPSSRDLQKKNKMLCPHNRSHATSYVRVVIETYLGAMQYVKTRSVHMDSEVHLAEGRSGKVSRSY